MLKVFESLCGHEVDVHKQLLDSFKKVESVQNALGDSFALLKDRVSVVSSAIELQELKREISEERMTGAAGQGSMMLEESPGKMEIWVFELAKDDERVLLKEDIMLK